MQRSGNTVLITGGASGIGLALATVLLGNGNTVIVCGRDQTKLDAASRALPGLVALQADVTDPASRASLIAALAERYPALNVLVNNAGLLHLCTVTDPAFDAALEAEVAINLVAPVALITALLPALLRQPEATIVNVTTGYVFLPSARVAGYSATKAALRAMTRVIRFQLRATSVRVVEVMPPAVDTAMATHYIGAKLQPDAMARQIYAGLVGRRTEIVVGRSRLAQAVSRLMPRTAFAIMNRGEHRDAALAARSERIAQSG